MTERILAPQAGLSPESNLGGEVYDREMIGAFLRAGVHVDVLLPRGAAHPVHPNLVIHQGSRALRYTYEYNLRWLSALNRLARETHPLVVRCHTPYALGYVCLKTGRRNRIPVAAHYHHLTGERQHDLIDRCLARQFSGIVTVSEFTRERIVGNYGVDPERIHVVPNGVSVEPPSKEQIAEIRTRHDLGTRPVVLALGQLVARKNMACAIAAFAHVVRRVRDAVLVIAGKGSQREELENLAAVLGIAPNVRFIGFVPEQDKGAWLGAADVFVFPSFLEGFGMAAAEAMACGTPVVASNTSAIPEVVRDGETGFLADPNDAESFAEPLIRLLTDAGLREQMGEAARAYARESFNWDHVAARVLDIYRKIASNYGR